MYSFSTCWNSHRHTDGRAMLREIRELGFEYAELSHGIRVSLLPGILEAVEAGEIKISSLHNFCPLPMGVNYAAPNLYQFSSDRPSDTLSKRSNSPLASRPRLSFFTPAASISKAIPTNSSTSPLAMNVILPNTRNSAPR